MTWFKNSPKLLISFLSVVLAFSLETPKANAFSLQALDDFFTFVSNDGIAGDPVEQYLWETNNNPNNNGYCSSISKFGAWSSWSTQNCRSTPIDLGYKSWNKGYAFRMNTCNTDDDCYKYGISNVSYNKYASNYEFKYYDETQKGLVSVITDNKTTYTYDGKSYDSVLFRHSTLIFWNTTTNETLQYMPGGQILKNGIIFSDPFTTTGQNVWLIKFDTMQAWSVAKNSVEAGQIMIGSTVIDPNSYFGIGSNSKYYNLFRTGAYFWPTRSEFLYNQSDDILGDTYTHTDGFVYSESSNVVFPGEVIDLSDTNYFNTELIGFYNQCVNKGENLRKALQLSTMCKLQGEDSRENIIINTGLNYTGSYSYCVDLDKFISNAYSLYSGNWNTGLINENVDLQDNEAPFNDLIFSWYYHSVFIDDNHNISGLPVGNNWCVAYTVGNFYDNEKSTIERISDWLTDFFGSGVAGIYEDTIGSHSTFSGLVSSISAGTSGFFNNQFFDPYIDQFNSGYNKFYSAVNMSGCSVIKQTFPDTIYGDLVFYVAVVSLIFIFIRLL